MSVTNACDFPGGAVGLVRPSYMLISVIVEDVNSKLSDIKEAFTAHILSQEKLLNKVRSPKRMKRSYTLVKSRATAELHSDQHQTFKRL